MVLSDIRAAQDYISYSNLKDPRAFYDLLKARGVTHLMYPRGERRPGRWNNTLLFAEIFRRGPSAKRIGKIQLNELPREAPPHSAPYLVLVSGQREYPDGIYKLEQLDVDYRDPSLFEPRPRPFKRRLRRRARGRDRERPSRHHLPRPTPRGYSKDLLSEFESPESFDGCEYYLRRCSRR